ncbi:hypothetical protein H257_16515 [Aphanomyces astaci]|uniref:Uncharacterized protein n=2 Tax=Aphanomyces astaci TaxID=112090 RepID=W4FIG1_APHAT|nr:hypothetical protein H257_16515 [Aphanomyces astaci]ETV67280.1 hypothetical protein H257_16515 [Aphanomyces astaci]|eukprot:XP_009843269.1 hypothetical protein H257_16515 [Aphanomyces astaci]
MTVSGTICVQQSHAATEGGRHARDMHDLIAAFEASTMPVESFPQANDITRAYATCGRMAEALYLQAQLVERTSIRTPEYVHRLLVTVAMLGQTLQWTQAGAVLLSILNQLPLPLNRHDGLFLMAYIESRQGRRKRAELLWRQCFGPAWCDLVNQPHAWYDSGCKWFTTGHWEFAVWMFAEGMPSPCSALHAVPMPVPAPNAPTTSLYIRSILYSTRPNFAQVDDLLTMAMKSVHTKYDPDIRSLCIEMQRHDIAVDFAAQDAASCTIGRAFRTWMTWRHHRAVFWMESAVRAFQTYKRPHRHHAKKSRTKKALTSGKGALDQSTLPLPSSVPEISIEMAPTAPPHEDLVALYGASSDEGDYGSRLRFILHRAKVIADKSTTALTFDHVSPPWLKQLHTVRDMVRSDVYMTQWKAGVLRNLAVVVALMEAANGPTECSRYGHTLLKDIELCRMGNIQPRMDQLMHLATSEESKRNLPYFHLLQRKVGHAK